MLPILSLDNTNCFNIEKQNATPCNIERYLKMDVFGPCTLELIYSKCCSWRNCTGVIYAKNKDSCIDTIHESLFLQGQDLNLRPLGYEMSFVHFISF